MPNEFRFASTPIEVPKIDTKHRKIVTKLPVPESLPILEAISKYESSNVKDYPPIIWSRAKEYTIEDKWGNRWIDFSSGVLITNAGHGRAEMVDAIVSQAKGQLLTSYCFPHESRRELVEALQGVAPRRDDKVMLLSTGSEATEMCVKLSREHGRAVGKSPNVFVSFDNSFHGRTLGAQLAGGVPDLKKWIGYDDTHFVQVPFPDGGVRCGPEDNEFSAFERSLCEAGVSAHQVCGVMTETYQGGNSSFAPTSYIQQLRQWCNDHKALLIMDEVQAGFGRTGTFWGFEHYGIQPDLIACGKGISGSLPISAVIGRSHIMDLCPPGSMTSTHSGNPVCCAAALASLKLILAENLPERASRIGSVLQDSSQRIQRRFSDVILASHGKGLVTSLHCVKDRKSTRLNSSHW